MDIPLQSDIKERIYKAQCIGNIEPIEYMMPYPSMRSLIEGQVINNSNYNLNNSNTINVSFLKHGNHDLYTKIGDNISKDSYLSLIHI